MSNGNLQHLQRCDRSEDKRRSSAPADPQPPKRPVPPPEDEVLRGEWGRMQALTVGGVLGRHDLP